MSNLIVQNVNSLQGYLNYIQQYPILSVEEERDLFTRYNNGDLSVVPTIATHNLRFVAHVVLSDYATYSIPPEDLIQEGNIGLLESIAKFKLENNVRFVTYAKYAICYRINEYIRMHSTTIRTYTSKNVIKIKNNYNKIPRDQLVEALRVSEQDISDYENISKISYVSIDQYDEDNPAIVLSDNTDILGWLVSEEEYAYLDKIKEVVDLLDDREKDIFVSRNLQLEPTTMSDLSKKYNISIARVGQLENHAKFKIGSALGISLGTKQK